MRTIRLPAASGGASLPPVGARLLDREGQHEADARALAHASLEDLGETVEDLPEGSGVKRDDRGGRGRHGRQDNHAPAPAVQRHQQKAPRGALYRNRTGMTSIVSCTSSPRP